MKAFERTACTAVAAVVFGGCHETLTQLEPQLAAPPTGAATSLSILLPGLGDILSGDTLGITPPMIALRLIAAAEQVLAETESFDPESARNGNGAVNAGTGDEREAEDRERARRLIRWAKAALSAGDHARAIQRGYYACRLLGALPR